jgi:molybdopterin-guanine dinucleotide biosynthesis protein A/2-polyprenyl-3-methyl-5-hydroxy-6-metoxy-1,4-benzoquinol methylase
VADRGLTGVLLAGGASTRFGSPKSEAVFDGETLFDRAWRVLGEACDERLVVGPGGLADPGTGPVAAIAAGLRAATHDLAVVVPVDMPLLTADALRALAAGCRDAAVGPRGPLPCAVSTSAVGAFETGERRLRAVLSTLDTALVELDDSLLANVNEPQELAQLMSGVFQVGGEAYDDFMGRYAVRLAPLFADFADVQGGRALDVGAGTGALTSELLRRGADVVAAEPSTAFCAALRERHPALDVRQVPAEELPFEDGSFDVALAQLVVAFMADAPQGIAEMARVARSVAICMWGVEEMEMFAAINRAASALGVSREAEQGARRYRTPGELHELLAPYGEVEQATIDITAPYEGFDDFWNALSRQVGPAGAWLASLDDEQREQAHAELFSQLGSPSGAFTLTGRCYAARVSTDARSAPVPTSVTSTSSSRSTNST